MTYISIAVSLLSAFCLFLLECNIKAGVRMLSGVPCELCLFELWRIDLRNLVWLILVSPFIAAFVSTFPAFVAGHS